MATDSPATQSGGRSGPLERHRQPLLLTSLPLATFLLLALRGAVGAGGAEGAGDTVRAGEQRWRGSDAPHHIQGRCGGTAVMRLRGGANKKKTVEKRKKMRDWDSSRGVLEVLHPTHHLHQGQPASAPPAPGYPGSQESCTWIRTRLGHANSARGRSATRV
jgi:hypothetical protein